MKILDLIRRRRAEVSEKLRALQREDKALESRLRAVSGPNANKPAAPSRPSKSS
jgi:hypothetical protein